MKLNDVVSCVVVLLLFYFGFSEYDLAFCRWFIYIYQGFILCMTFTMLIIYFIPMKYISTNVKVPKISYTRRIFGLLYTGVILTFLYNTPHTTAFNIITFISISFIVSFYLVYSKVSFYKGK